METRQFAIRDSTKQFYEVKEKKKLRNILLRIRIIMYTYII